LDVGNVAAMKAGAAGQFILRHFKAGPPAFDRHSQSFFNGDFLHGSNLRDTLNGLLVIRDWRILNCRRFFCNKNRAVWGFFQKRQMRGLIPVWASGPGNGWGEGRGLKAGAIDPPPVSTRAPQYFTNPNGVAAGPVAATPLGL